MRTLDAFVAVAKLLPQLIKKEDIAIWACDEEKFLVFDFYGRFNIKLKAGDALTPGGTPDLVVRTKKSVSRYVPREVYGVICHTNAIPVEGGAIGISLGVEDEDALQQSLVELNQSVEQIGISGSHIADDATLVTELMTTIMHTVSDTNTQLKEIDQVGELIRGIADESRLISLNALIESARAGEHGRSFSVVAKEMQKLADETAKSIINVRTTLQTAHNLFGRVNKMIVEVEEKLRTQSGATQEIAAALEEISATVKEVEDLSKRL